MAAHYTNVTQAEIEEYLFPQGFKKIIVAGTNELIYAKRVDRDGLMLTLRVYSSITANGNARECGADAMRVTIFWRRDDGSVKMAGGSKRVHRVLGWRINLQKRIDQMAQECLPKCGQCGAPMLLRKGKKGEFWGCASFPECRHTMNIPSQECAAETEIREIEGGQI